MPPSKFVFIVGVSRSGTTLMRRILNKSTQIALCDENFYLGHLVESEGMRFKFRRFGDLQQDENVRRLVDFIYSPEFESYSRLKTLNWQWRWFRENVAAADMLTRILASDRSERAVFVVLMELFADAQNAEVLGEKTPAHLRYVPTIMKWFPEAKIIHMMRDPRAIYTSEVRRRLEKSLSPPYRQLAKIPFLLKLFLLGQVTVTWRDGLKRWRKHAELYGDSYRLVRFEELVSDPESGIPALCRWLDVEYQNQMMAQNVVSEGFQSGTAGFDAQASRRWEKHIDRWARAWFEFRFRKELAEVGYVR